MQFEIVLSKKDGNTETIIWPIVNIKHLRPTKAVVTTKREFLPEATGGYTVLSFVKKNYPTVIYSKCSSKEKFCRRIGIVSAVVSYINRHIAKNTEYTLEAYKTPTKDNGNYVFLFKEGACEENPLWFLTSKKSRRVPETN